MSGNEFHCPGCEKPAPVGAAAERDRNADSKNETETLRGRNWKKNLGPMILPALVLVVLAGLSLAWKYIWVPHHGRTMEIDRVLTDDDRGTLAVFQEKVEKGWTRLSARNVADGTKSWSIVLGRKETSFLGQGGPLAWFSRTVDGLKVLDLRTGKIVIDQAGLEAANPQIKNLLVQARPAGAEDTHRVASPTGDLIARGRDGHVYRVAMGTCAVTEEAEFPSSVLHPMQGLTQLGVSEEVNKGSARYLLNGSPLASLSMTERGRDVPAEDPPTAGAELPKFLHGMFLTVRDATGLYNTPPGDGIYVTSNATLDADAYPVVSRLDADGRIIWQRPLPELATRNGGRSLEGRVWIGSGRLMIQGRTLEHGWFDGSNLVITLDTATGNTVWTENL